MSPAAGDVSTTATHLPVRAGKATPALGTLWLGDTLPRMELICLLSMVAMRWDITVFSYTRIKNLPREVTWRDAREVYPKNRADADALGDRALPPPMFADIFRLHMIQSEKMVWVDSDFLAVAERFPPVGDLLFCNMISGHVNNAVLYADPAHPFLRDYKAALDEEYPSPKPYFRDVRNAELEARRDSGDPVHCNTFEPKYFSGPTPLRHYLDVNGCADQGLPHDYFYPISYNRRKDLWRSYEYVSSQLTENTVAIHLWGSFMRKWFTNQVAGPDTFFAKRIVMLDAAVTAMRAEADAC